MEKRINREYKSTLFALIFGKNKKDLLDLFNAINGTSFNNPEELEYTTLESDRGFFMQLKNDLSFVIDRTMGIYEHQSSPTSANITLRLLHYYSDLLRRLIDGRLLYREKEVRISVPQFIVFYNGKVDQEDEITLCLSNLFEQKTENPDIELRVRMLNVNEGKNLQLMEACSSLAQYAKFVNRMRKALDGIQDRELRWKAAADTIDACIKDNILSEVLHTYRREVIEMYYWEYDEEAHRWAIEKDAEEKGMEKGMKKGMEKGIKKGIKKGIAIGSEQGEILQLIRLMTKKIRKNKSLTIIADELESDPAVLQPLWDAINAEAPAYNEQSILRRLFPDPVIKSEEFSDSKN